MKVTCFIDSLSSGGAQRQLCTLAALLKKRGMDVSMLTYHPHDFFLPMIREAGIAYRCIEGRGPLQRLWALRRALRQGDQDVVLAFLEAPSLYAELASLPRRSWGLVVSERSEAVGEEKRDFNGLPTGGQAYTLSDGKRSVETLSKQRGGWLS